MYHNYPNGTMLRHKLGESTREKSIIQREGENAYRVDTAGKSSGLKIPETLLGFGSHTGTRGLPNVAGKLDL